MSAEGFRTLYEYNADTCVAKVYSRRDFRLLLEVHAVSMTVGTLLNKLAEECFLDGVEFGEARLRGIVERAMR